jgi:hypothetical protein
VRMIGAAEFISHTPRYDVLPFWRRIFVGVGDPAAASKRKDAVMFGRGRILQPMPGGRVPVMRFRIPVFDHSEACAPVS